MIKSNKIFFGFSLILIVVVLIMGIFNIISYTGFISALSAIILNFVNTIAAIVLFDKSFEKNNKIFLFNVLGGMGVRILFLLLLFFIILKTLNIEKYQFIFTFFILYFLLLGYEVFYYTKKINKKNE